MRDLDKSEIENFQPYHNFWSSDRETLTLIKIATNFWDLNTRGKVENFSRPIKNFHRMTE